MKKQKKRITVYDIAKKAGVSQPTVSSALHNRGRVSESKKNEILQIARDLGYQPLIAAQLLRAKATGRVGLFICENSENVSIHGEFAPLLVHFVKRCEMENIAYHIEFAKEHDSNIPSQPSMFSGGLVDGGLVLGLNYSEEKDCFAKHCEYPIVSVGGLSEYAVVTAFSSGVFLAVQHLVALGHRRIAYIGGDQYYIHDAAFDGFINAVNEFSLSLPNENWNLKIPLQGDFDRIYGNIIQWGTEILNSKERPTAFFCNDMRIARVLIYATVRLGLRIPEDISVIATGAKGNAERGYPLITSIEQDFEELIASGLNMLLRRINKKQIKKKQCEIPFKLHMRNTVCPPQNNQ